MKSYEILWELLRFPKRRRAQGTYYDRNDVCVIAGAHAILGYGQCGNHELIRVRLGIPDTWITRCGLTTVIWIWDILGLWKTASIVLWILLPREIPEREAPPRRAAPRKPRITFLKTGAEPKLEPEAELFKAA